MGGMERNVEMGNAEPILGLRSSSSYYNLTTYRKGWRVLKVRLKDTYFKFLKHSSGTG